MKDRQWLCLLAAIREKPGDDHLRLVAADWLEENGQEARAEFIRLGVAHNGEQPHNTFGPVGLREEALLYPNFQAWLEGVPKLFGLTKPYIDHGYNGVNGHLGWHWSRGFVSRIACGLEQWLACGKRIVAAWPLERVEITDRAAYHDDASGTFCWSFVPLPGEGMPPAAPRWTPRAPLHWIPEEIGRLIPLPWRRGGEAFAIMDEDEDPGALLSAACLEWARAEAASTEAA